MMGSNTVAISNFQLPDHSFIWIKRIVTFLFEIHAHSNKIPMFFLHVIGIPPYAGAFRGSSWWWLVGWGMR